MPCNSLTDEARGFALGCATLAFRFDRVDAARFCSARELPASTPATLRLAGAVGACEWTACSTVYVSAFDTGNTVAARGDLKLWVTTARGEREIHGVIADGYIFRTRVCNDGYCYRQDSSNMSDI